MEEIRHQLCLCKGFQALFETTPSVGTLPQPAAEIVPAQVSLSHAEQCQFVNYQSHYHFLLLLIAAKLALNLNLETLPH